MDESTPLIPFEEGEEERTGLLTRHQKAAWILDEIIRGIPVTSSTSLPATQYNRSVYLFFHNTEWLRQCAVILLVLLSFFDLPSWCSAQHFCQAPDSSDLSLSGISYFQSTTSIIINFILLSILVSFAVLDYKLTPMSLHTEAKRLNILLSLLVIDFVYVALCGGYPPVRIAPFIRAILPLFYWGSLKECTLSIFAVTMPFLDVVFFVILFTLLFGWVVTILYHDLPEANEYFGDLLTGIYSAFTSMTTADWPMQVVGILDKRKPTTILFIFFIVIGVFLLFNVLLAVVYNAYTEHIENLVAGKFISRRSSLTVAYNVLKDNGEEDEEEDVGLIDVTLMFKELRKNKTHARFEDVSVNNIFNALDDDNDNILSCDEFADIVDIMQLKFIEDLQEPSPVSVHFPTFYSTGLWQSISNFVQSHNFNYVIGAFMIFNIIVVFIETTMDLRDNDTAASVIIFSWIECAFSIIYVMEMILKILVCGIRKYWNDMGNRFDFYVTWLLLFASIYVLWPYVDNDQDIIRLFILLRCLRLFSLLADVPRFRRLVRVFSVLIPASVPLFTFLFLSLYIFSALGVELFGGLIYKGNPLINPEIDPSVVSYISADYWDLNFNDMASAWFTLFCSVIVAYLTEIASVIVATSKFGNWTRWYFIANFVVNTLIVSNCVVAFVVDLFVMEDENEAEKMEEDSKLLADVQSRYGSKRVRVMRTKTTAHQVYSNMFKDRLEEIMEDQD